MAAPAAELPAITIPPADFNRFFDGFIASTKKQWGHDRTKTLGGSEVFGCIRKAFYSRHDTPKDPDYEESWGATRRGDLIENYHVVPAMQWASNNDGFKIDYVGSDQQTLFCDGVPMSVTPDGLIHGIPRNWLAKYGIPDIKSDCVMFEIKSIDPRVDLSEEKAIHHGQTQIQMGLVHENTKFRPNYAVILYVNASFFDDMNVFIVEWDPNKYEVAKERSHLVYDATDPSKLMREGKIDGSCRYCPYQNACTGTTVAGMPPDQGKKKKGEVTDVALVGDLEALVLKAREVRHKKKKIEKDDELLKEEIKNVLRDHKKRRANNANWSLSYSMADGKKSPDIDLIKRTFAVMADFFIARDMTTELDMLLKVAGVGEDGQNEARTLDIDSFMKEGNPYEILRMTFTEPENEDE